MMCFDACSFLCVLLAFTNTALEGLVYRSNAFHAEVIPVHGYIYSNSHSNTMCLMQLYTYII